MQEARILLEKYRQQTLNEAEMLEFEHYIATGEIPLEALEDLDPIQQRLDWLAEDLRSQRMQTRFQEQLQQEKQQLEPTAAPHRLLPLSWRRWAAIILLPLLGWGLAQWQQRDQPATDEQLVNVQGEIQELRELLLLSLLEKENTSERLKAVHLTREMQDGVGERVISALFTTLQYDPNANVRLACIDELSRYVDQARVREGLVKSIRQQDSPLVLLALAELMANLKEKRALQEFDDTMNERNTPPEIRTQIRKHLRIM